MINDKSNRVYRGGGWYDLPSLAQVALRGQNAPGARYDFLGIRLVRYIQPLQQLGEVDNER